VDISAPYLIPSPSSQATILRLVGNVAVSSVDADSFQFAVGVGVVSQEVIDGGTNIPLPLTDQDTSWYFWAAFSGRSQVGETVRLPPFDIRTARKLRSGFALILVFETGVSHGGANSIDFQARGLWTRS